MTMAGTASERYADDGDHDLVDRSPSYFNHFSLLLLPFLCKRGKIIPLIKGRSYMGMSHKARGNSLPCKIYLYAVLFYLRKDINYILFRMRLTRLFQMDPMQLKTAVKLDQPPSVIWDESL